MNYRRVESVRSAVPTIEGSRVFLRRAMGFYHTEETDPFLMLDDFGSDNPVWYEEGFPVHPHRGYECITYMHTGSMEQRDSLGNRETTHAGGVQQLITGSGIIHEEIPRGNSRGKLRGFQLWVNLPSAKKMTGPCGATFEAREIPEMIMEDRIMVRVISGEYHKLRGPLRNDNSGLQLLDIIIPPHTPFLYYSIPGYALMAYVVGGSAYFDDGKDPFEFSETGRGYLDFENKDRLLGAGKLIIYGKTGEGAVITSGDEWTRMLLFSGKPLGEPVAWYGPVVMNKKWELRQAFEEYEKGSFVKAPPQFQSGDSTLGRAV